MGQDGDAKVGTRGDGGWDGDAVYASGGKGGEEGKGGGEDGLGTHGCRFTVGFEVWSLSWVRTIELGGSEGLFYIGDEGFVIVTEKLMNIIASTVYIQSCDTEILRSIGKKCKQNELR